MIVLFNLLMGIYVTDIVDIYSDSDKKVFVFNIEKHYGMDSSTTPAGHRSMLNCIQRLCRSKGWQIYESKYKLINFNAYNIYIANVMCVYIVLQLEISYLSLVYRTFHSGICTEKYHILHLLLSILSIPISQVLNLNYKPFLVILLRLY